MEAESQEWQEVKLQVGGMTCGRCVQSVQHALESVPGVVRATVSLSECVARVHLSADGQQKPVVAEALVSAVQSLGKSAIILTDANGRLEEAKDYDESETDLPNGGKMENGFERRYSCGCSAKMCCCSLIPIVTGDRGVLVHVSVTRIDAYGRKGSGCSDTKCCDGGSKPCWPLPSVTNGKIGANDVDSGKSAGREKGLSKAVGNEVIFTVDGMTCGSCTGKVEKLLGGLKGVVVANVSLLMSRAVLRVTPEFEDDDAIRSLASAGFQAIRVIADKINSACVYLRFSDQDKAFQAVEKLQRFPYVKSANIVADSRHHGVNDNRSMECARELDGLESQTIEKCGIVSGKFATLWEVILKKKNMNTHRDEMRRIVRTDFADKEFVGKMSSKIAAAQELTSLGFTYDVLSSTDPIITGAEDAYSILARHARWYLISFLFSLIFTLPLVLTTMILGRIPTIRDTLNKPVGSSAISIGDLISWILATPVQFISGYQFYRGTWFALRSKRATMDVLIALGTSIAYFFSVIILVVSSVQLHQDVKVTKEDVVFETSALLITIVLLGKWIEARTKHRTARSISTLAGLRPQSATVVHFSPPECDLIGAVSCELVSKDDHVRVNAGDFIPIDGNIVMGETTVDESMLTGESWPVRKSDGDDVYGGTINGKGSVVVRCSSVSTQGVLAKITDLVERAQTSRAPVELFADRVSSVFVPVIILIAVITFAVWFALAKSNKIPNLWYRGEGSFMFSVLFALSVLVISCPCALGLATPNVILIASQIASKRFGILFRNGGGAIQAVKEVGVVLFDKTGTLTLGKPSVTSCLPLKISENFKEQMAEAGNLLTREVQAHDLTCSRTQMKESGQDSSSEVSSNVLRLIRTAERLSDHPIAQAITSYVDERIPESFSESPTSHRSVLGKGIECNFADGVTVRVGEPAWVMEPICSAGLGQDALKNVSCEQDPFESWELALDRTSRKCVAAIREAGKTIVFASVNYELISGFGIEDPVRPESKNIVEYLQTVLKLPCGMVTGDGQEAALVVAQQVGIHPSMVKARTLPDQKMRVVNEYKKDAEGLKRGVLFVGDGINDAAALASASVGIAMGSGSVVAAESADVVLVRNSLTELAVAIDLAHASFRKIKLNYLWALLYNCIGIPLAAGALYPVVKRRLPPYLAAIAMAASSISVMVSSLTLRLYKPPTHLHQEPFDDAIE